MGKRLRSSVQSSAEELLYSAASKISTKPGKAEIKSIIWSIGPSSCLVSSLPAALHLAILNALESLMLSLKSGGAVDVAAVGDIRCSTPPAPKKFRRSARLKRSDDLGCGATPPRSRSQILDIQKKLRAYTCIAHLCASHPKKLFSPSDLLPLVQFLHDNLVLYDDPSLMSEVASLCEWWWKDNLPERESLISQSLPFLLSKSLTHCKKTDVRRIYAFREAFTLFDYEDESIEDLRLLLVRCVINPLYLKTKDGRSFIAFMVGLNGLLLKEALALIKSQIPFGKKSVLEGYADIIFKAWRGSEHSVTLEIEDGFLQDLIEGAIHANTKQFAASIRKVVNGFVGQRTTPGVEKVLFRLAEPVLFRSLQVANSNVRQNALFLLLDLFPLEDPDATKEEKDTLLERQFFLLQKLLTDDCPEVRGVAVEGLCRILNLFWEVIPSLTITKILGKVIDDMTRDICNEVRLSTLNGIIYLLENPQSHEIMKVLLPKLNFVLSDPSLSVRIAATDLLLVVGHIRSFQFKKIVSLDTLFSSLANDHERVARKITRLLIPSYFPPNLDPKEACSRFNALMRRSLDAAARFCEFALSEGSSSKSLMELLRSSLGLVLAENDLSSDHIDGLIIASANICSCMATELSNKALVELLLTDKIKSLFNAATSSRAQIAVLSIASVVSSNDLHGLHEQCLFLALECIGLSDDLERHGLIRKIHRLFFSFGFLSELIGRLSSILQNIASRFLVKFGLDVPSQVLQSIKKKIKLPVKSSPRFGVPKESIKTDKFKIEKDLCLAAGIAWTDVDMRKVLFQYPHFEVTLHSLTIISQVSIEICVRCESFDTSPIEALATLAVYLILQNDGSVMNDVLDNDAEDRSWCMNSHFKGTILSDTLNKLLHSAEKIFNKSVYKEFATPTSKTKLCTKMSQLTTSRQKIAATSASNRIDGCEFKLDMPKAKCIENVIKMCTSILKFIADTKTMNLIGHNDVSCLRFASAYARYVLSSLGGYRREVFSFNEDDLKEAFYCLKSSFTYAAKLLHLVLKRSNEFSAVPGEVFYLSNDLLDLITAIEPYFGIKLALQMSSVVKPWLPVLILGVGCNQLIKSRKQECQSKFIVPNRHHFPTWLAVLSKAELYEISKVSTEEDDGQISEPEGSVFTNLILMAVSMLKKGSLRIVDAFGCVMLVGLDVGLDTRDFGLLLGLVHFICVKLLGEEFTSWNELEQMTFYLQEIYPRIEDEIANPSLSEDERKKLETAKTLLTSLCLNRG
ncbi:uncharacterized protein LOC110025618 [Phalaenopsis equestris]|uniref:uncharacterized protein LOC110025618 n=1 Tax=Phalaenopsis equestris TaxID=78828 RepID=UPI0009E4B7BB|nr:uncharacterized protein LOC110025618 [Phalaenopsis equestris]